MLSMVTSPNQAKRHAKQLTNVSKPTETLSLWAWIVVGVATLAVIIGVAWKTVTPALGGMLESLSGGRIRTFRPSQSSNGGVIDF